jgi:hypothetical protein
MTKEKKRSINSQIFSMYGWGDFSIIKYGTYMA